MSRYENFATRECLVPLVDMEDFTPDYKKLAEESIQKTGRLTNSAKAMAHSDLALIARTFFSTVAGGANLGSEFALLIRLLVSNLNTCVYCSTHQTKSLVKMGLTQEKIENVHAFKTHSAFSERERAALEFAMALTLDSANIPDDVCERFTATFTPEERVEITLVASAMGMLNRFNDGLRVPIEEAAQDTARSVANSFS
jgi:AhpD family alkylhydroperoxidase